jgi:protein gp37
MQGGDHRWTGKVVLAEKVLDQPLRWRRPRRIFVNSMSDLFHEAVPDEWIDRIFAGMARASQHTFQVLTKRPERMRDYLTSAAERCWEWTDPLFGGPMFDPTCPGSPLPLPNVWLGVSVEDQAAAYERIPLLLDTPAAIRFISAEPLLGPVDIDHWLHDSDCYLYRGGCACTCFEPREVCLDWVIAGGESGPGSRPAHPDWFRSLRDQCATAGVAFFFKQNGNWLHDSQAPANRWDWDDAEERGLVHGWPDGTWSIRQADAGRKLDGRTHEEFPEARA